MTRYYRLSPKFWSDPVVQSWDDDARLLAIYILTSPHRTTEGLFRLPKQYILADLQWLPERLPEPFQQLLNDGFIEYHEPTQVLLITAAMKYQGSQNENQATHALSALDEVPESPLDQRFQQLAERFNERLAKRLPERFSKGYGNPPAPTPAPTQDHYDSETESSEPPLKADPGKTLSETLASWCAKNHLRLPPRSTQAQAAYRTLLEHIGATLPSGHPKRTWVLTQVIVDSLHDGAGVDLAETQVSHLMRLVKTKGALPVFDAAHQAVMWGAGLDPRYADDPMSFTKYIAGVFKETVNA